MSFVDWFIASFLYCFPISYRSSNDFDSNSCCSFMLFKALAKSNGILFAITKIYTKKFLGCQQERRLFWGSRLRKNTKFSSQTSFVSIVK
jgi:hypothetical protein